MGILNRKHHFKYSHKSFLLLRRYKYKHHHLRRNSRDVLTWYRYSEMNLSLLYMKLLLTVTQRYPTVTFSWHSKVRRPLITTNTTRVDQIIAYPMASHTSWLLINFKQTQWAKVFSNGGNDEIKPMVSGWSSELLKEDAITPYAFMASMTSSIK